MTSWWEDLDGPLLGRYRIERVLGEGGMARVFLATDLKTGRIVAIKTPKLESFPPDRVAELLKRFNREFQSQIKDPIQGVVPVFDADEVIDRQGVQRPILVMQYLTGGSLGTRLGGRVGAREHTQTLGEVLDWLVPIAGAIDALHRRKFLHRDIKPDNILFDADDKPYLADFGVIGLLDAETDLSSTIGSSVTGMSPGSPGYMAPESIQADALARNAPASDQFSLGITVYEALSGRLPMAIATAAAWYGAIAHWLPEPLEVTGPGASRDAAAAVIKAISAKPQERFMSCSDFARAMKRATEVATPAGSHRSPPPPPSPPLPPPAPPRKPRSWRRGLIVACASVLILGLVLVGAKMVKDWLSPHSEIAGDTQIAARAATDAGATGATPEVPATAAAPAAVVPAAASTLFDDMLNATETDERSAALRSGQLHPDAYGPNAGDPSTCVDRDTDSDGVSDCWDMCITAPKNRPSVDPFGCGPELAAMGRSFKNGSADFGQSTRSFLDDDVEWLKAHPQSVASILGFVAPKEADALAGQRARKVYDYYLAHGVNRAQLMPPTGMTFLRLDRTDVEPGAGNYVGVFIAESPSASKKVTESPPEKVQATFAVGPHATNRATCESSDRDGDFVDDCRDLCDSQPASEVGYFGCPLPDNFRDRLSYFEYRSVELPEAWLAAQLALIQQHPGKLVGVAGPKCALGIRRVNLVYQYLIAHGVDPDRVLKLEYRSFSYIKPQPTDKNSTERWVTIEIQP